MTQCRGNRVGETKADGSWFSVAWRLEKSGKSGTFNISCAFSFLGCVHGLSGSVGGAHSAGYRFDRIPKVFLNRLSTLFLFLFLLISLSLFLLEKHHDYRDSDGKIVSMVGPRSTRRFRATKSSRAGQLEMPWKQNRYLILTKPRPHKRIFSGSRFRNESSRVDSVLFRLPFSPFSSPLSFSLSTDLLFVFVSGVCVAKPPLLLERKYRG